MAIGQPRKLSLIPDIKRDSEDWTVTVQVVERHHPKVGNGTPGKPGKRYRRYMLVVEEGNKVSGIVYETDTNFFNYILLPFKCYNVSNAYMIPAVSFFELGYYPFSWGFGLQEACGANSRKRSTTVLFEYELMDFADLTSMLMLTSTLVMSFLFQKNTLALSVYLHFKDLMLHTSKALSFRPSHASK